MHGAIDGVGGHALDASLELIADRSRIFTLVEHGKAADLGVRTVPPKRSAARLAELADLYAQGRLQVHLHRTFPLEKAADAHRHYKAGGIRGKIVLTTDALHGAAGGEPDSAPSLPSAGRPDARTGRGIGAGRSDRRPQ